MNIYVSNIPYTASDEQLRDAFGAFGNVQSARVIKDRATGRSRGFGFVEMTEEAEGLKAVEALNGSDLQGRRISAREARPREEGMSPRGPGGEDGQRRPSVQNVVFPAPAGA
jgi:RNA recognition motif-containing protein